MGALRSSSSGRILDRNGLGNGVSNRLSRRLARPGVGGQSGAGGAGQRRLDSAIPVLGYALQGFPATARRTCCARG